MLRKKVRTESDSGILTIRTAPIFQPLLAPARYKDHRSLRHRRSGSFVTQRQVRPTTHTTVQHFQHSKKIAGKNQRRGPGPSLPFLLPLVFRVGRAAGFEAAQLAAASSSSTRADVG